MKILAFGEVMMRLMPPDYKLLTQTNNLEYLFTGTGVNVLSGLYRLGNEVYFSTVLPKNSVGYAAADHLRKLGINDKLISFKGDHMGMYFLEVGVGRRPSKVTYMNRRESSFGKSDIGDYDINKLLEDKDAVHICGISLALNSNTRNCAKMLAKEAKKRGIKVIFDCNFRPSLWNENERALAKDEYIEMLNLADVVFAGEKDAELLLEIECPSNLKEKEKLEYLIGKMRDIFSIDLILGTIRKGQGEEQQIQGYLLNENGLILSDLYDLIIYDRVGGGDGFAVGAIHALLNDYADDDIVEFATCSGVLAHTTYGDSPIVSIEDIERLKNGIYMDLIR
ncbi:MAG: sugar kinase [Clostridium sp.]|nr:sugar kinase [Clostridium sp.]